MSEVAKEFCEFWVMILLWPSVCKRIGLIQLESLVSILAVSPRVTQSRLKMAGSKKQRDARKLAKQQKRAADLAGIVAGIAGIELAKKRSEEASRAKVGAALEDKKVNLKQSEERHSKQVEVCSYFSLSFVKFWNEFNIYFQAIEFIKSERNLLKVNKDIKRTPKVVLCVGVLPHFDNFPSPRPRLCTIPRLKTALLPTNIERF